MLSKELWMFRWRIMHGQKSLVCVLGSPKYIAITQGQMQVLNLTFVSVKVFCYSIKPILRQQVSCYQCHNQPIDAQHRDDQYLLILFKEYCQILILCQRIFLRDIITMLEVLALLRFLHFAFSLLFSEFFFLYIVTESPWFMPFRLTATRCYE